MVDSEKKIPTPERIHNVKSRRKSQKWFCRTRWTRPLIYRVLWKKIQNTKKNDRPALQECVVQFILPHRGGPVEQKSGFPGGCRRGWRHSAVKKRNFNPGQDGRQHGRLTDELFEIALAARSFALRSSRCRLAKRVRLRRRTGDSVVSAAGLAGGGPFSTRPVEPGPDHPRKPLLSDMFSRGSRAGEC